MFLLHNGMVWHPTFNTNLSKSGCQDGIMENRNFIYLESYELEEFRENMIAEPYKSIAYTLKLHQVATKVGNENGLYIREFACACENCLNGRFNGCTFVSGDKKLIFEKCVDLIKYKCHNFESGKIEDEIEEDGDIIMNDDSNYIATEASLVIAKDNIAVIRTND